MMQVVNYTLAMALLLYRKAREYVSGGRDKKAKPQSLHVSQTYWWTRFRLRQVALLVIMMQKPL